MAQSRIIMAFRKRAKSFGYTNISIKYSPFAPEARGKNTIKTYQVYALEPLGGLPVKVFLTEQEMYHKFRR